MLIKCPECEFPVSEKAISCPHCGYPMKPEKVSHQYKKSNKRMRLPNGFGQISEIKNKNLRNRFRVMVTVGKTETGKPISKLLKPVSYFPTYNEAYAALVEYNKNPYDLDKTITMKELYEKWSKEYFEKISDPRHYEAAWLYSSSIYNIPVKELRPWHIKNCIENGTKVVKGVEKSITPSTRKNLKLVFNLMLDYAVEYDLVERNISRNLKIRERNISKNENSVKHHLSFNDKEMSALWNHVTDIPYTDALLIQCYSGWRPSELCNLRIDEIDLENGFFRGGMKTEAGRGRVVPIHSKIYSLVQKRIDEAKSLKSKYLFNCVEIETKPNLTYRIYATQFKKIIDELKLNSEHKPHDGRKQFVTMAKKYKVDDFAIKYMAGHKIVDITESIYTDRDENWLKTEIEKIK